MNGFGQKKCINFNEMFTPRIKLASIKTILSIVIMKDFHLEQLDMMIVFLHGDFRGRNLHAPTKGIWNQRKSKHVMPAQEKLVWFETSTKSMIFEIW